MKVQTYIYRSEVVPKTIIKTVLCVDEVCFEIDLGNESIVLNTILILFDYALLFIHEILLFSILWCALPANNTKFMTKKYYEKIYLFIVSYLQVRTQLNRNHCWNCLFLRIKIFPTIFQRNANINVGCFILV